MVTIRTITRSIFGATASNAIAEERQRQRGGEAEAIVEGDLEKGEQAKEGIDRRRFPTGDERDDGEDGEEADVAAAPESKRRDRGESQRNAADARQTEVPLPGRRVPRRAAVVRQEGGAHRFHDLVRRGGRWRILADAVVEGPGEHGQKRHQRDRREEQCEDAGGEGQRHRPQGFAPGRHQLEETVDRTDGDDVQYRLRMAEDDQQHEGDGQQSKRRRVAIARHAPHGEQHERQHAPTSSMRPRAEEGHAAAERERRGCDERCAFAAFELAREGEGEERGQEEDHRRGEGRGQVEREQKGDQIDRIQRRGLHPRREYFARVNRRIPQRPAVMHERLPHLPLPRHHLQDVIEQQSVVRLHEAVLVRVVAERRAEKEDVVAAIDAIRDQRFAGEEKRQQENDERVWHRHSCHPPPPRQQRHAGDDEIEQQRHGAKYRRGVDSPSAFRA
jgi:hypothetical protein